MKASNGIIVSVILTVIFGGIMAPDDPLPIGAAAPLLDHSVTTTENQQTTLRETAADGGLLVIFTCNTCPWVDKWEDRFNPLAELAESLNIGVIFLNPNEALRTERESLAEMRQHAKDRQYLFTYAVDKNHVIADAFGASRTPESFLFDGQLKLVYRGAIDDNARDATAVMSSFLADAMRLMSVSESVPSPIQKAIGCTIKRVRSQD